MSTGQLEMSNVDLSAEFTEMITTQRGFQANSRIIQHVAKRFKGHEDKFYVNIERYGNTSAASIPIALDELWQEGRLKKGMKIICVGFGAGLTWSSALLQV